VVFRRLAGVGSLQVNLRCGDGGVPGTTELGLAWGEVRISLDGDLGYSTSGSSTNASGSNPSSKCGGDGGRSTTMKGWNSSAGANGGRCSGVAGE
jgi:hypothetical protein